MTCRKNFLIAKLFFKKFQKSLAFYFFMCYNIYIIKQRTKYIERLKGDLYEINKSTELYNGEGAQRN